MVKTECIIHYNKSYYLTVYTFHITNHPNLPLNSNFCIMMLVYFISLLWIFWTHAQNFFHKREIYKWQNIQICDGQAQVFFANFAKWKLCKNILVIIKFNIKHLLRNSGLHSWIAVVNTDEEFGVLYLCILLLLLRNLNNPILRIPHHTHFIIRSLTMNVIFLPSHYFVKKMVISVYRMSTTKVYLIYFS